MGIFSSKKSAVGADGEPIDTYLVSLSPDEFAELWQLAWNSRSADEVLNLCTNDITWADPLTEQPIDGKAAVRHYLEEAWRTFPDLNFTWPEKAYSGEAGKRLALHWRATGTMQGPLNPPGYAPTGKSFVLDGVDLLYLRDGKVFWYFGVFDRQDVAQQVGILPAPDTKMERFTVKLHNTIHKIRS